MTVGFALLVGSLPVALLFGALLWFEWRGGVSHFSKTGKGLSTFLLVQFVFMGAGFCIPFAWETFWLFGFACVFFTYGFLIGYAVALFSNLDASWMSMPSMFGVTVCTIVAVPLSVLPALRASDPPLTVPNAASATVEAATDISAIEGKFSDLQQVLQAEGEKIQASLESVLGEVESQNSELKDLRAEEQRLTAELETYKKLLELDQGQVAAIQRTLRKKDATDYWVGLLTGVLSSAAVAFSSSLLGGKGRPRKAAAEG